MKKKNFPFSLLFTLYHGILAAGFLTVLLSGKLSVTTDFMSLLPAYGISEGVSTAEKQFASRQNAYVNILVGHHDFNTAKACAERLFRELDGSGVFAELRLQAASMDTDVFSGLLSKYRYQLLPDYAREEIVKSPDTFQADSLSSVFSPVTFAALGNLDADPFFVDNIITTDFLAKISAFTPVSPKEGVLAVENGGMWFVLLQGTLSDESLDISNTDGGVSLIYAAGDKIAAETEGLDISYSGFPFHSYESSSNAQKEITVITTVSIGLIILLFLAVLRNIHVVGLFLLSTFFSIMSALAAVTIFFPDVHVLTMIFGTSLIGTSIDYAIHYYLAYGKRAEGEDGRIVAGRLLKNLAVSFGSTVLCYFLILFSPYDILRQVALFSVAGLTSSFLTVMGLFPVISRPSMVSEKAPAWKLPEGKPHRSCLLPLLAVFAVLFAFTADNLKVSNSVLDLYQMSDRLLESEKTAGRVLGFMGTSYAIVEGVDEYDAREKEYKFSLELEKLKKSGVIDNYLSASVFIPAPSVQKLNFEVSRTLGPLLESQCGILGVNYERALSFWNEKPEILGFSDIPPAFSGMLNRIIIGGTGDKYYLAVLVFGGDGLDAVEDATQKCSGVTYFRKSRDVNIQLDELTKIILKILAAAFVIIIVLLLAVFRKKGFNLALSPVIIITAVLACTSIAGLKIDFFFAVGLLLVIGLGLDYMVFAGNSRRKPMLAISLSYLTTALSFGSLMLSSFKPVHTFGLTVFIGITAAFLTAICSKNGGK